MSLQRPWQPQHVWASNFVLNLLMRMKKQLFVWTFQGWHCAALSPGGVQLGSWLSKPRTRKEALSWGCWAESSWLCKMTWDFTGRGKGGGVETSVYSGNRRPTILRSKCGKMNSGRWGGLGGISEVDRQGMNTPTSVIQTTESLGRREWLAREAF